MKFICIMDSFFLSRTKDVTFIWVEAHAPILFPSYLLTGDRRQTKQFSMFGREMPCESTVPGT